MQRATHQRTYGVVFISATMLAMAYRFAWVVVVRLLPPCVSTPFVCVRGSHLLTPLPHLLLVSFPIFFPRLPHTRNCLPHTQRTRHDQARHPHLCLYVTRAERWVAGTLCDVTHATNATCDPADHLIVCVFKHGNRRSDWLSTATTSHTVVSTGGVQQRKGCSTGFKPTTEDAVLLTRSASFVASSTPCTWCQPTCAPQCSSCVVHHLQRLSSVLWRYKSRRG